MVWLKVDQTRTVPIWKFCVRTHRLEIDDVRIGRPGRAYRTSSRIECGSPGGACVRVRQCPAQRGHWHEGILGTLFDYVGKQKNYREDRRSVAKLSLNPTRDASKDDSQIRTGNGPQVMAAADSAHHDRNGHYATMPRPCPATQHPIQAIMNC